MPHYFFAAVVLVVLGATFIIIGATSMTGTRRTNDDGSDIAGSQPSQPAWGFLVTGLLLFVLSALTFLI